MRTTQQRRHCNPVKPISPDHMPLQTRIQPHSRLLKLMFASYLGLWVALAFNPVDRSAWVLENALVGILLLTLLVVRRQLRFSHTSLLLTTTFRMPHAFASHYTPSQ